MFAEKTVFPQSIVEARKQLLEKFLRTLYTHIKQLGYMFCKTDTSKHLFNFVLRYCK